MPILYTFKWNPPTLDDSLRQWLQDISVEELRQHLKAMNRKEWADVWIQVRPFVVLHSVVLVIVCTILGLTDPKGIWETILLASVVGLFFSAVFAIIGAGSLLYDVQWRRWHWYKKEKLKLMKSLSRNDAVANLATVGKSLRVYDKARKRNRRIGSPNSDRIH